MKKVVLALLIGWMAGVAMADEPFWLTNLPLAAEQAKKDNKLILVDFTGSDWCGWCKKLDAETFSQPAFIGYAQQNLVLVQLDFPRQKSQPQEMKLANQALRQQYEVSGFPTILLLKPDGTLLWKQTGYLAGGPEAMIAKIKGDNSPPTTATLARKPPPSRPPTQGIWTQPPPNPDGAPRLQAILYSSHPIVMLEGKSCEVGDSVKGMRVLKIERDCVTVEWKGETKVLKL